MRDLAEWGRPTCQSVLAGQGKVEEAAAVLREALRLNPEDHNARLELAKLLAEHDRAKEALLEFEALGKHGLDDEMAQEVKDSVERLKRKMSRQ